MKQGRTLGLVAVVAMALLALFGVGSAYAGGFTYTSSTGASHPYAASGNSYLKTINSAPTCYGQSLSGRLFSANPKLVAEVSDASCSLGPMEMNGCKFILRPGSNGTGAGTFDIGPPGCGPITKNGFGAQISIGAQTGLAATFSEYSEGGLSAVAFTAAAKNLKYTLTFPSGPETRTDGEFGGTWVLKGYEDGVHLNQSPLGVTKGGPGEGVYLAGEQSGEKAKQPGLEAEAYPMTITGSQTKTLTYKTPAGNIKCTQAPLNSMFSAKTNALSLEGAYSGCVAFGQNATVAMNSCHYVFNVANAGPGYSGTLGVSCSKEGDGIKVTAAQNCSLVISPQASSVTYENVGTGSERYVNATVAGEGLTYKVTGTSTLCGTAGTYGNGSLVGTVKLQA